MVAVEDDGGPCDIVTPRLAYYALADEFTRELSVPALSEWGVVAMVVLLVSAGVLVCGRAHQTNGAP